MIALHSADGWHFLGLRQDRSGMYQIVYDGQRERKRFIWSITNKQVDEQVLSRCLRNAVNSNRTLDTLQDGLKTAKITFEVHEDILSRR